MCLLGVKKMVKKELSGLRLYSLGIVTKDKPRDTTEITVCPIEDLPLVNGPINDHKVKFTNTLPNGSGATSSSKTEAGMTVTAKWLPLGNSNRGTAPDVYANETVLLLKYGDNDEYWWTTVFNEPGIRRLETVCWMLGDLKDPLKEYNKETSYWVELSTHDQHLKIHTSRSNGEPFCYDFIINTKEGYVELKDDVGNGIKLDSKEGAITLTALKTINLNAPDVNISGRSTTKGSVKMEDTAAVEGAVSMNAAMTVKGTSTLEGNTTITGAISLPGMSTVTGGIQIDQNLSVGSLLRAKNIIAETVVKTGPLND